jgi:N-acetylmuramoyl-L-alanine amidase-like protein/VCBS repeat protein/FG-GAP repeat protein
MSLRTRVWVTLGAVTLGGAGVVGVAMATPDHGKPPVVARAAAFHTVKLTGEGKGHEGVAKRGTETFSMLGISWPQASAGIDGKAQVRTRSIKTGEWTGWQDLEVNHHSPDGAERKDAKRRGATTPLWVGPSDGVEARVVAADGTTTAGLPKGLRLDLVDPGVTKKEAKRANRARALHGMHPAAFAMPMDASADPTASSAGSASPTPDASVTASPSGTPSGSPSASSSPSATASPSPSATVPTAPPSTVHRPPIITRAEWGADESEVKDPPTYNDAGVQIAFVHHTAETNGYSCTQSAAIMRSMMDYHIHSNGWNDLGYNFVVDKCGRIFEGRAGGIDLPVHGAHTYGFNSYSTGIAVMGRFDNQPDGFVNRRIDQAVARIAAYKLGQYGVDPTGEVTLTAMGDTGVYDEGDQATLKTVSGHRDGFNTACPGDDLYAQLPSIRRYAASPAASSAIPTSDVNRDGTTDLVAGMPAATRTGHEGAGMLSTVPGGANGPETGSARVIDQSSPGVAGGDEAGDNFGAASAYGDLNGDGYADLVVGVPGEEWTSGIDNHGFAAVLYGPGLTEGASLQVPDAQKTSNARFGSALQVSDVNSDGYADVVAVSPGAPGKWWLFDGKTLNLTESGYLSTSAYSGDSTQAAVTSGDFDRDGYADVAVNYVDPGGKGRVLVLNGSKNGLVRQGVIGTPGGRAVAAGDTDGDGYADLVIGQPFVSESGGTGGGQITVLHGSSSGLTTTGRKIITQDTSGVSGSAEDGDAFGWSVSVGDTNNDMNADVLVGSPRENLTRSGTNEVDAGMAHLLYGGSGGVTGTGSLALTQDTSGIPGAGESWDNFGSSVQLSDDSGWGRTDLAIGAEGENNGDGGVLLLPSGSAGIDPADSTYAGVGTYGAPSGAGLGNNLTP